MKYTVVIVTYNRLELLKECIEAINNQKKQFDSVVIVDNASTDGTKDYLQGYEKNIILYMRKIMEVEQKDLKMAWNIHIKISVQIGFCL